MFSFKHKFWCLTTGYSPSAYSSEAQLYYASSSWLADMTLCLVVAPSSWYSDETSLQHSKTSSHFTPELYKWNCWQTAFAWFLNSALPLIVGLLRMAVTMPWQMRETLHGAACAGIRSNAKTHTRSTLDVLGWNMPNWWLKVPAPVSIANVSP